MTHTEYLPTSYLPASDQLNVTPTLVSGPEFYNPHDDDRLQKLIENHRTLFAGLRETYAEVLGSVLHNSALRLESDGMHGDLRLGVWRIELDQGAESADADEVAYAATHIKVRGVLSGEGAGERSVETRRPLLIDEHFDLADILPEGTASPAGYMQVDTVMKVTNSLVRSTAAGTGRPRFEHQVTRPDGSTGSTLYSRQKRKLIRFPSYSQVLDRAIPSGLTRNFEGLVGVATEKVRRRIAVNTWEEQFGEAFNEGRPPMGILGDVTEVSAGDSKANNPLRPIARYAGAGMLADLPKDQVVDVFLNRRIRQWAGALLGGVIDPCEDQEQLRGRARWAADYGEAFQNAVEQRLAASPFLIRDHVSLELVPFRQVAIEASAFAFDIGGVPLGQTYDGAKWRMATDRS